MVNKNKTRKLENIIMITLILMLLIGLGYSIYESAKFKGFQRGIAYSKCHQLEKICTKEKLDEYYEMEKNTFGYINMVITFEPDWEAFNEAVEENMEALYNDGKGLEYGK